MLALRSRGCRPAGCRRTSFAASSTIIRRNSFPDTHKEGTTRSTQSRCAFCASCGFFLSLCSLIPIVIAFGFRFVRLLHLRLIPFPFAESLNADQVNAFPSVLLYEADTLVLRVGDLIAGFEFCISHVGILPHEE